LSNHKSEIRSAINQIKSNQLSLLAITQSGAQSTVNPQCRAWAKIQSHCTPLPCPCIHGAPEYEGARSTSHSKSPAPPGTDPRAQATALRAAGAERSCAQDARPRHRARPHHGYAQACRPRTRRRGGAPHTPPRLREDCTRGPTGESTSRRPDAALRLCLHHAGGWSAPGKWQGLCLLQGLLRDQARGLRPWAGRLGCLRLADG
jgi:hypothetical protein